MKRIKIFLASSIEELKLDRLEIGDFFDRLNGIYHDRGIDLKLIKCENYDNSIALNGKQSEYDDEIRDSELVFFLFFKKVGDVTRHEFEVAVESFKEKSKPHIFTYFKYTDSLDEATDAVKEFMDMLAKDMAHYYNSYKDIDTLKLGMLMQIQLFFPAVGDMKIEDGKITIDDEEFISTNAIPAFSGNKSLQQMKEDLKAVNEEFFPLQKRFIENPGDKNAYSEFLAAANKKNELEKGLKDAEENTLKLLKSMVKKQSEGDLSVRQAEGYRLLEAGDYDGALAVLSLDEIYSDIEKNESVLEYAKDAIQQNVNELLSRIEALEAKGVTPESIEEIDGIYKKACEISEKNNLKKDILYTYTDFLVSQKRYEAAILAAKRLEHYYELEKPCESKVADLYDVFGRIYCMIKEFEESEKYHLKSLEIYKEEALKNPDAYISDLSSCYNNLGCLYIEAGELEKAADNQLKALSVLEEGKESLADFDENVTSCYNNLGAAYNGLGEYEEAEKCYLKSVELLEKLEAAGKKNTDFKIARTYGNLGVLKLSIKEYEKAEEYFLKSIELTKQLVLKNPEAFEYDLGVEYVNIAKVYEDIKRTDEAEKSFLKGIDILEGAASKNPEAFTENLASAYIALTLLFSKTGRYEGTEGYFLRATEVLEKVKGKAEFELDYADCHNNMGVMYLNTKSYEDAEKCILKAIELLEELVQNGVEYSEARLAAAYNNLGNCYLLQNAFLNAEAFYLKSLKIREELAFKNPEEYENDLLCIYVDMGDFYRISEDNKNAIKYYERARKIKEKDAFSEINLLLHIYYYLGNLYFAANNFKTARVFFEKSMEILEKLFEKEPAKEGIRLSNTYISMAVSYIVENKKDDAKRFLDKAKSICERFRYKSGAYAELLETVNGLYGSYGIY